MAFSLKAHKLIKPARKKELLFFMPRNFRHFRPQSSWETGKTLVSQARRDAYKKDYNTALMQRSKDLITFESTPGYVMYSTFARNAILCTFPWAKLLVLLRHPIDRIWSEFNFYSMEDPSLHFDTNEQKLEYRKKKQNALYGMTFDEWVRQDIKNLKEAGVFQDKIPPSEFYGSKDERAAWQRYQMAVSKSQGVNSPVARGLYTVQLEEWFDGLRQIGRNPETETLVLRTEDMKADTEGAYNKVISWLELPPQKVRYKDMFVNTGSHPSSGMSNETITMLMKLYEPYNKRLYKLMGSDWEGVFDGSSYSSSGQETKLDSDEALSETLKEEEMAEQTIMNPGQLQLVFDPPNYDEEKGKAFTDKWCELDGVSWYPPPHEQWQLRAPYFILPGAKKSGTTSLAYYLTQHPLIEKARAKELQFFLNKNFRRGYVTDERKTLVKKARDHLYEFEFHSDALKSNSSLISMDATPGYLFFSDMLPQRILCVAPWVKIVIILRNPVDRFYSNYKFGIEYHGFAKVPIAVYANQDMKLLERSGFLNATTPEEETKAWRIYLKMATEGPLGRSMYEIQLREWFQAMRDAGRDPSSQIHIVRLEDMHGDVQGTMKKVYRFLGLPFVQVKDEESKVSTADFEPLNDEVREKLEELFRPYNEKLYNLLIENGFGDDWLGYWEKRTW